MKKEKFSEAVLIRVVVSLLILTAICLKAMAKAKSIHQLVRVPCNPEWESENQLTSSNRQSNV